MEKIGYFGNYITAGGYCFRKVDLVMEKGIEKYLISESKAIEVGLVEIGIKRAQYNCAQFYHVEPGDIYVAQSLLNEIDPDWLDALKDEPEYNWEFRYHDQVIYVRKNGDLIGGAGIVSGGTKDNHAATPQPDPKPGQIDVADVVISDIQARVAAGVKKYGTKLQTHNGRDALMDAYQEAIDLVMYLRQKILEEGEL